MKATPQHWIQAAEKLGNQIAREAIWDDDLCNWMSVIMEPDKKQTRLKYHMLDADFYDGTAGIAFFMASLFEVTEDPLHRKLALGALHHALRYADQLKEDSLGFYLGQAGVVYSAVEVGERLGEDKWVDAGVALMKEVMKIPLQPGKIDLVNGAAGALLTAIYLEKKKLPGPWMDYIRKVADWLLEQGQEQSGTLSWDTMEEVAANLTGFAHGAAGLATVLLEAYEVTEDNAYREAAEKAIAYENERFHEAAQNWPDYRQMQVGGEPAFAWAWCHGAPGIGLSRLKAWQVLQDDRYKEDALRALRASEQQNRPTPWSNYSLCHGLFGNAELALMATEILDDNQYLKQPYELARYCIDHYLDPGIPVPNGAFQDWYNPGLMLGLSGMGYYFLRLADPVRFPSVLMISQPNLVKAGRFSF
jgi:type 2 lantibiotic biosynthesis protein LanM